MPSYLSLTQKIDEAFGDRYEMYDLYVKKQGALSKKKKGAFQNIMDEREGMERQELGNFIYNKYSVLLVYYVVIGWAHKMLRRYFLFMQDAIWVHLLLKKAIFMRLLFTRHSKTVAIPPRKRVLCIVALYTLPRKVPGENRQFAISGGFFGVS